MFDRRQDRPAGIRELQTGATTLEQRRTEPVLQQGDPPADRRLLDIQLLCRLRETTGPGRGFKRDDIV